MAATREFLQGATDASNQTSYTFSSQNLGTADSDRYIVVVFGVRAATAPSVTDVTVGGISASSITQVSNTGNTCAIAVVAVPTGTSGDVVVSLSGSGGLRAAMSMYRVLGIDSATPSDSGTSTANDPTFALDVPADGIAIAGSCIGAGGITSETTTWTGLTENYDANVEAAINVSSASDEFASEQTGLSVTSNFGLNASGTGVFLSWAPAASGGFIDNTSPILRHIWGAAV